MTEWKDIQGDSKEKYALYLCSREWAELKRAVHDRAGGECERCRVNQIDDGKYKVEATFVDFQRGRIWQDAGIVSQWYKPHGSYTLVKTADDRFFNVTLKAEKSKFIREVINRSVNQGLKAWFYDRCEKLQEGLLDDATVKKIVSQFATKGVNLEMIEQLLGGKPQSAGWTVEDKLTLLGIWNALKNNETTVAELFRDEPAEPKTGGNAPSGAVSAGDLTKQAGNGNGNRPPLPGDDGQHAFSATGQLSDTGAKLLKRIEDAAGDMPKLTALLQETVSIYKPKAECGDPEGQHIYARLDSLIVAAKKSKK